MVPLPTLRFRTFVGEADYPLIHATVNACNQVDGVEYSTTLENIRNDYEHLVNDIRHLLTERGTLSAAEVRDHFNTSRKYVLALLEHLDAIGVTQRVGDVRRLR